MSVSKEIEDNASTVKKLLIKNPTLRESDRFLASAFWKKVLGENRLRKMTAEEFLDHYMRSNELASQESIGRARRKVQQDNPELRGKRYRFKKLIETQNVKVSIKKI
jgi:hypothetical protein